MQSVTKMIRRNLEVHGINRGNQRPHSLINLLMPSLLIVEIVSFLISLAFKSKAWVLPCSSSLAITSLSDSNKKSLSVIFHMNGVDATFSLFGMNQSHDHKKLKYFVYGRFTNARVSLMAQIE